MDFEAAYQLLGWVRVKWGLRLALVGLLFQAGCFPSYSFRAAGGEVCTNGVDDDGDGEIDCDDSDCTDAGYQCVPAIPEGWSGPVAVWTGGVDDSAPDCSESGGYALAGPADLKTALSEEPAECADCECSGEPTGASSSLIVEFRDNTCPGKCILADSGSCAMELGNGCHEIAIAKSDIASSFDVTSGLWVTLQITDAKVTGGTCQSSTQNEPIVPDVGYSSVGKLCKLADSVDAGSCQASGYGCVKTPSSPYLTRICIYQDAEVTCPDGWTDQQNVYYSSVDDTRGCASCCAPNWDSATLTGSISERGTDSTCLYASQMQTSYTSGDSYACSGTTGFFTSSDTEDRFYSVEVTATGGTCPSTTGQAIGAVAGVSPHTVCCAD